MASADLMRLHKLYQVDAAMLDIRKQAAAMTGGQVLTKEIEQLKALDDKVGGEAKSLGGEQKDLELANDSIEAKLKKIDKEMYGGTVMNTKEVGNLEKEIVMLKNQRSKNDDRLLELMDLVPPAKAKAEKVHIGLAAKIKELDAWKVEAAKKKVALETRYKELAAKRPELVKVVPQALLTKYENIRTSHHGVGLAVITKNITCSECGTAQPERTIKLLEDDKVVQCESCSRILYYTTGLI